MTTVGVAIPSIPPRTQLLRRAFGSAIRQHRLPDTFSVVIDHDRAGAAATRNRAWRALTTDYVAFLDDDDELLPEHLERLLTVAEAEQADMTYSWFSVVGGTDPMPDNFGRPWDPDDPRQTTITCLWRREALEAVDGFPEASGGVDALGNLVGEDYLAVLALNAKGGRIVHLPERTWRWHHWMTLDGRIGNTSGMPDRW